MVVGSSQGSLKTYSIEGETILSIALCNIHQDWCSLDGNIQIVHHLRAGHEMKLTDKVEVRSTTGKEGVGPRIIGLEVSATSKTQMAADIQFRPLLHTCVAYKVLVSQVIRRRKRCCVCSAIEI